VSARADYYERLLAALVNLEALRLGVALGVLILEFYDKEKGKYLTEARLGDRLVMDAARLHGRSLDRARQELIEAGVIVRFERGKPGRGNRSLYVLVGEARSRPARENAVAAHERVGDDERGVDVHWAEEHNRSADSWQRVPTGAPGDAGEREAAA
jgi:hypothetical protein